MGGTDGWVYPDEWDHSKGRAPAMSDNLKPCRWLDPNGEPCDHQLLEHLAVTEYNNATCHGCPCHEPQPDPTPYTEPPKDANE